MVSKLLNLPEGAKGDIWTGILLSRLSSESSSFLLRRFFFWSLSFGSIRRTVKGHSALLASSTSRVRLRGAAMLMWEGVPRDATGCDKLAWARARQRQRMGWLGGGLRGGGDGARWAQSHSRLRLGLLQPAGEGGRRDGRRIGRRQLPAMTGWSARCAAVNW